MHVSPLGEVLVVATMGAFQAVEGQAAGLHFADGTLEEGCPLLFRCVLIQLALQLLQQFVLARLRALRL